MSRGKIDSIKYDLQKLYTAIEDIENEEQWKQCNDCYNDVVSGIDEIESDLNDIETLIGGLV